MMTAFVAVGWQTVEFSPFSAVGRFAIRVSAVAGKKSIQSFDSTPFEAPAVPVRRSVSSSVWVEWAPIAFPLSPPPRAASLPTADLTISFELIDCMQITEHPLTSCCRSLVLRHFPSVIVYPLMFDIPTALYTTVTVLAFPLGLFPPPKASGAADGLRRLARALPTAENEQQSSADDVCLRRIRHAMGEIKTRCDTALETVLDQSRPIAVTDLDIELRSGGAEEEAASRSVPFFALYVSAAAFLFS